MADLAPGPPGPDAAALEQFAVLHRIAQDALSLLRAHRYGPPGITGLQEDLRSACADVLAADDRSQGVPPPAAEPADSAEPVGPMTSAEYAGHGGSRCPFCRSENVEGATPDVDGPAGTADESCLDCGKAWKSVWRTTGYFVEGDEADLRDE